MKQYTLVKFFVSKDGTYKNKKVKNYVCTRRQAESLVRQAAKLYPVCEGWANLISSPRKPKSERCSVRGIKCEYNVFWVKRYNQDRGTISIWIEESELSV